MHSIAAIAHKFRILSLFYPRVEHLPELLELRLAQMLREDIRHHVLCRYMLHNEMPVIDDVPKPVHPDVDVLAPIVLRVVQGEGDARLVVLPQ